MRNARDRRSVRAAPLGEGAVRGARREQPAKKRCRSGGEDAALAARARSRAPASRDGAGDAAEHGAADAAESARRAGGGPAGRSGGAGETRSTRRKMVERCLAGLRVGGAGGVDGFWKLGLAVAAFIGGPRRRADGLGHRWRSWRRSGAGQLGWIGGSGPASRSGPGSSPSAAGLRTRTYRSEECCKWQQKRTTAR